MIEFLAGRPCLPLGSHALPRRLLPAAAVPRPQWAVSALCDEVSFFWVPKRFVIQTMLGIGAVAARLRRGQTGPDLMRSGNRQGMTLAELLISIAILAVLIALLLPAVNAARETGRQTGCATNPTRLALAFIGYNFRLGYLPGWRNRPQLALGVPTSAGAHYRLASWAGPLVPETERIDVFNAMLDTTQWHNLSSKPGILLTEYLGPSFKPKTPHYAYSVPITARM